MDENLRLFIDCCENGGFVLNLNEANTTTDRGLTKFRGKFQEAEAVNKNKRIYPYAVLDENVKKLMPIIQNRGLIGELDHPTDSIVHFAAYKAAGESMEDPGKYFGNNVAKTSALVDAARTVGVDKVVFSSSCSVYGTPQVLPVDESHPFAPESPYAESKRIVEDAVGGDVTSDADALAVVAFIHEQKTKFEALGGGRRSVEPSRSEEHTSELQSH